jgi:L-glyceraldehyde 3-phosphate reductase
MSLNWILKDDDVTTVLVGASKPQQLLDNIKIVNRMPFSAEELDRIDEICKEM